MSGLTVDSSNQIGKALEGAAASLAAILLSALAAIPQPAAADDGMPLRTERRITFETDEGTWMSLDVSPASGEIVFELLGDLYVLPAQGGAAQPLVIGLPFDSQPVVSPDGRRLAFISDRSGSDNLWIADADGQSLHQVTHDDKDQRFISPAWSADGDYVFVSRRAAGLQPYELWMFHRLGGAGLQVVGDEAGAGSAIGAAASSDGKYLYYALRDGALPPYGVFAPVLSVTRRDLHAGASVNLINSTGGAVRPEISPDGRYLAYGSRRGAETELRLRDLMTGADRLLIAKIDRDIQESRAFSRDALPGYSFTADGKEIVIAYGGKIHRVNVDSGDVRVVPFKARVALDVGPNLALSQKDETGPVRARVAAAPKMSPDGKRLAFAAFGKIYVMSSAGGPASRVTGTPFTPASGTENQPNWSPNGRFIVYVSWTKEGGHLWMVPSDGEQEPRRLSAVPGYFRKPAFSPDGKYVLTLRSSVFDEARNFYDTGERPYAQELIRVNTENGSLKVLASLPHADERFRYFVVDWGVPHFTEDTESVAVYTGGGFVTVPLAGGSPETSLKIVKPQRAGLTTRPQMSQVEEAQLSPDGKWALVLDDRQLYVVSVPAAGRRELTLDLSAPATVQARLTDIGADFFDWSADGKFIHWSIGSTFYRKPLSEELFEHDSAPGRRIPEERLQGVAMAVERPRDAPRRTMLLRGATAITMRGEEVIGNADILVRNNRIAAIGRRGEVSVPLDAIVRDVSGRYITPGFIDSHAHWNKVRRGVLSYENWDFTTNLAYGVTAGLEVQGRSPDMFVYQDMIDAGMIPGPRAYNVGRSVDSSNNFADYRQVLGVLTRYKKHYRTNNLKSYLVGNRQQRQWVVAASKELGIMPTTEGGADDKVQLTHAIDGMAGNEHALHIFPLYTDVVQLFVRTGIAYTPTVTVSSSPVFSGINYFLARQSPLEDAKFMRFVPEFHLSSLAARLDNWMHDKEHTFDDKAESAGRIFRAGGKVGLGSHGNLPGLGVHWEMQAFAMGGLSTHEVLQIATRGSAEVIGHLPDIGTLAPGKYADLVILQKDPLEDIRNTQSIIEVMKNGRLYSSDDLGEILAAEPAMNNDT